MQRGGAEKPPLRLALAASITRTRNRMPTRTEPFVSVVTPVHNTEAFLAECIESVLCQTYRNFEYIIVDNCSTDETPAIAERYASKDRRIRVINAPTVRPQAANYNFSLQQISADSQFCKIVQADDYLFPRCLSTMVRLAETNSRIAIVGAYQLAGADVKCQGLECQNTSDLTSVVEGSDACRLFLLNRRYLFGTPTSVLYRSDAVRDRKPFFNESSYHEDSELCFEVLDQRSFGFVHQILTYTRVDNVSISTEVQDFDPDALHAYIITKQYGRRYLTAKEFDDQWRRTEDAYYNMLAFNLFRGRSADFWSYHRKGLELTGERLDSGRLYRMQVPRLLNLLGNPKMALERVLQRLLRREDPRSWH